MNRIARALAVAAGLAAPLGILAANAQEALPAAPSTLSYSVLFGGRPAGTFVETAKVENGWATRQSTYTYNDRGRGPSLGAGVVYAADGLPVQGKIQGRDYWKNPVDEVFEIKGDSSTWKNDSESGKGRRGFYLTLNQLPGELPALARALLRTADRRLPLLPAGEARLEEAARLSIEFGGGVRPLTLYTLQGLSFTPLYLWLDADGELFASLSGWLDIVREGGEKSVPDLWRRQQTAMATLERDRAARLASRPAGPLAIRGARLFDPETGGVRARTTVVVRGERVQIVGADGEVEIPADAQVIDAAGKLLLPGLWDMHVHAGPGSGLLFLSSGITTVRDMGNDPEDLLALAGRFDRGEEIGPRVVACGFLDGSGPYAAPTGDLIDTEKDALDRVDRYASSGFAQVKLYSSLSPALVPAIVARAHARGLRVSGHIPYGMSAALAVEHGFDEIQHANFLFLNFWPEVDTRTPARFAAVGERAAALDLGSEPVARFLALLKEKKTVIDPTLNVFEDLFLGRVGQPLPSAAAVADRLPPQVRRGLLTGGFAVPAGQEAAFRAAFPALLAMVRKLRENGVAIVGGTDNLPGFTLARELELYVQAGYPEAEVLRMATLGAARTMKRDADLGSIAPGKLADFVLIDGDPLREMGDIRKVALTVKGGVLYDPVKLWEAVGVQPWK